MKLLLFSVCIAGSVFGQLPETDIWLVQLDKKDNKLIYTNPLNINNRAGYDNQPTFSSDTKSILYVSIKDDKQADIYQYNSKAKTHTQLTKTKTSEYSPTILPDGNGFSCVVVEMDSVQRVWKYYIDGTFNHIIAEQVDSVGYHSWLSKDTLLYYKLTNPHSLRAINLKTQEDVWICNHPSRAFKKIGSTTNFIYAIKDSISMAFRVYNPTLRESKLYATYPSVNEDFIWHPELGLIKSENADLLRYNEATKTWDVLFSFSNLGIKKITRFVFDSKNKQLAIVSNL